jgi:predicted nucleic acid-binding protein
MGLTSLIPAFCKAIDRPENDLWIAATALRHNLTLITYDAHFDRIPHVTKERW